MASYYGTSLDLHGLDPAHQSSFRTIAARGWIPGHGTQICPQCLADDGIWRITWRLPTTTVSVSYTHLDVYKRQMEDRSPAVGMTPLEVFDALLAAVGRLHVLQRPDLLYDLLPQLWLTIRHDGVEYKDLTFDCAELDDFRSVPKGFFRDQDRAAPFFMDPRDLSRLWFRRPDTGAVVEVPWRRAFQLQAPMTDLVLKAATQAVKRRGGTNTTINKDSVQREILEAVNDIASIDRPRANPDMVVWKPNKVAAAHLRESRSQFDHAEAAEAGARGTRRTSRGASSKGTRAGASRSSSPPAFDPTPVSYTHLDVYKRQVPGRRRRRGAC